MCGFWFKVYSQQIRKNNIWPPNAFVSKHLKSAFKFICSENIKHYFRSLRSLKCWTSTRLESIWAEPSQKLIQLENHQTVICVMDIGIKIYDRNCLTAVIKPYFCELCSDAIYIKCSFSREKREKRERVKKNAPFYGAMNIYYSPVKWGEIFFHYLYWHLF